MDPWVLTPRAVSVMASEREALMDRRRHSPQPEVSSAPASTPSSTRLYRSSVRTGSKKVSSINPILPSIWVFPFTGCCIEAQEGIGDMSLIEELRARQDFLSTVEVISLLHVTRGTLCEWVRSGRITAIRIGNAYLFDPRLLADWLTARTTKCGRGAA